jgi:hypothetical protein
VISARIKLDTPGALLRRGFADAIQGSATKFCLVVLDCFAAERRLATTAKRGGSEGRPSFLKKRSKKLLIVLALALPGGVGRGLLKNRLIHLCSGI